MASDTASDAPPNRTPGPLVAENLPSEMRADVPTFARACGMTGLGLAVLGAAVLGFNEYVGPRFLGPATGLAILIVGVGLLLFHAARDPDVQIRRTYAVVGLILILFAAAMSLVPLLQGNPSRFYPLGIGGFVTGLLFLLPFSRHEDEESWRKLTLLATGVTGIALAGVAFIGGNLSPDFLVGFGMALALLGLMYLTAAAVQLGTGNPQGVRMAYLIGLIGLAALAVALVRSGVAAYAGGRYFLPSGLLLGSAGLFYLCVGLGLVSDNRFVVLTRRELAAYFYSPIAYLVLFGVTVVGWYVYAQFASTLLISSVTRTGAPRTIQEPIVQYYIVSLVPVICAMFMVPVLTMRLLSEEKRLGTIEVLFTAPVDEPTVVLSKFAAGLVFYLFNWVPWGLFLIALRVEGGNPFDYRPLLSFAVVLTATGAAFVSMGLFFSALTRNQIVAAVMTAMGMIILLALFLFMQQNDPGPTWKPVFEQVNFISLWIDSLSGKLYLRSVLVQLSIAAFWLFLTIKVLESRRWS
jgi:ABC-type transport system involved in multi-copper enzyme maturation permease subunit